MAGEERREQLLRVAMTLFSNHGFRGTTTKEIAHAAGVSEAMVFRHFATKEDLYAAILDYKACSGGGSFDPAVMAAEAIKQKDDRLVFETLALGALNYHDQDPEFQRLLLHSALEKHKLAQMFFDEFVLKVYHFLGSYIRERQRDGALIDIDPAIVIRCFIGMVMHHSLNNNLWDPKHRLLNISNEAAAKHFTDVLLNGITTNSAKRNGKRTRPAASKQEGSKDE
jgi:AcrR family transcriptional regulator